MTPSIEGDTLMSLTIFAAEFTRILDNHPERRREVRVVRGDGSLQDDE